ncbi:hypothetical protein ANTRET_LOCUS9844 [Anthophora retusa]
MVERLHRQLKAAIKCHGHERWTETLPLIMLGIRSAFKEDIQATTAELVYGEPIRLPGEFLVRGPKADISQFAYQLRTKMEKIRPVEDSRHCKKAIFVFKELPTATHVFLRQGGVKKPLQPPYTGPYEVLRRDEKHFTLKIAGNEVKVAVDRVKPAFVQQNAEVVEALPKTEPKTKRRVQFRI